MYVQDTYLPHNCVISGDINNSVHNQQFIVIIIITHLCHVDCYHWTANHSGWILCNKHGVTRVRHSYMYHNTFMLGETVGSDKIMCNGNDEKYYLEFLI